MFRYWRNYRFALADLLLSHLYSNPYRTCRRAGFAPYGETPLTTLAEIAKRARITSQDRVIDLGSGRGRAALWLAAFIGCSVTALDAVPTFAKRGRFLLHLFPNLRFCHGQIETHDLTPYTVVYLYSFSVKLPSLSPHSRLITFSEPVEGIPIQDSFEVRFPWGVTDCYIQGARP